MYLWYKIWDLAQVVKKKLPPSIKRTYNFLTFCNAPLPQVCMSAGSVLQTLGHTRDAAVWLSRALRLADLVATEDHSLQLYTLLHR